MSWPRTFLLLGLALAIAGCGFRPLYGRASMDGQGHTTSAKLAAIEIAPIANRLGQVVHNHLRDGMNPTGQPADPAYRLSVVIVEANPGGLTRRDLGASRTNVQLRGYFTLSDGLDTILLTDTAIALTGYDVFQDPLNDISAREDAQERAAMLLAQMITARVAAYFSVASAP